MRQGETLLPLPTADVAWYQTRHTTTTLAAPDGRRFVVDYSLEQPEDLLGPAQFYRLNCQPMRAVQGFNRLLSGEPVLLGFALELSRLHAQQQAPFSGGGPRRAPGSSHHGPVTKSVNRPDRVVGADHKWDAGAPPTAVLRYSTQNAGLVPARR